MFIFCSVRPDDGIPKPTRYDKIKLFNTPTLNSRSYLLNQIRVYNETLHKFETLFYSPSVFVHLVFSSTKRCVNANSQI